MVRASFDFLTHGGVMFKIAQTPTFWARVKGELPAEGGGQPLQVSFRMQFKRLTRTELNALTERMKIEEKDDAWFLEQIATGWDEVMGDDNEPLPYTPENLRRVLDVVFAATPLSAFYDNLPKAKQKN
jgi:hypothetical protein